MAVFAPASLLHHLSTTELGFVKGEGNLVQGAGQGEGSRTPTIYRYMELESVVACCTCVASLMCDLGLLGQMRSKHS